MDRIIRLRIQNVRAIEYVDLKVSLLTVLIGENGSGKSTIIECLEILRKASESSFFQQLYAVHLGMAGLLRKGATMLGLGLVIEDDSGQLPPIDYEFSLAPQVAGAVVHSERMLVGPLPNNKTPLLALRRTAAGGEMFSQKEGRLVPIPPEALKPEQLVIGSFGSLPPQQAIDRLLKVLGGIEVHVGFDTLAFWAARSLQRGNPLRGSALYTRADRLSLLGHNLANAWSVLKNLHEDHWSQTLALVRLGLGDSIDTINTVPDAAGGFVSLALKRTDVSEPIPAVSLSDGQLAWLSFVAMARLNGGRSLLAMDEPEQHLHPALLGRVISLLAGLEGNAPVILSTHADRVLELIDNPASAVRVCSLERGMAVLSEIDADELPRWLKKFGDLGQLRASGYLHRVLVPTTIEAPEKTE